MDALSNGPDVEPVVLPSFGPLAVFPRVREDGSLTISLGINGVVQPPGWVWDNIVGDQVGRFCATVDLLSAIVRFVNCGYAPASAAALLSRIREAMPPETVPHGWSHCGSWQAMNEGNPYVADLDEPLPWSATWIHAFRGTNNDIVIWDQTDGVRGGSVEEIEDVASRIA